MKNIIKIITVLTTVVISSFAHSEYKVRSDVFMFKLPGADAWISGAEYNLYGSWVDVSSPVCGVWSPQITDQDASFIQSRSCDTDQERSVTIREYNTEFDIYRTTNTFNEERVYSTNEQRTVVVTASSWLDQGAVYSCSEWSPAINGQTSDFTQTRDCQQDQTRDLTYEINGSVVESKTISQTVIKTQSRVVDVASSSGGGNDGWSAWTTYSQDNNCTTWSPATSTVNQGQSFTQTRTCYDYQERFKYYVIDGQVVDTDRETRTVTDNKSRTNTGTKVVAECKYRSTSPFSYVTYVSFPTSSTGFVWDGVNKPNRSGTPPTSASNGQDGGDGYIYWAGTKINSTYYYICRQPK